MDPTCVFNFFTFFERILYKSNCIIVIFSWCATHTKIRSKLVVIVTAGSQKITLWGPQRTPLGILRVKGKRKNMRLYTQNLCQRFQMMCFFQVMEESFSRLNFVTAALELLCMRFVVSWLWYVLMGLNTVLSKSCRACVLWGGRKNISKPVFLHI